MELFSISRRDKLGGGEGGMDHDSDEVRILGKDRSSGTISRTVVTTVESSDNTDSSKRRQEAFEIDNE